MNSPQLSPKVEVRLFLLFPPDQQEQARTTLMNECGTDIPGWKNAVLERFRCAALKLSDGTLGKSQGAVNLARVDFGDVLMAFGFGEVDTYAAWRPEKNW